MNAHYFLKNGGLAYISIKASCIDSTKVPKTVFKSEVEKIRTHAFLPMEQLTLEPYEKDHGKLALARARSF